MLSATDKKIASKMKDRLSGMVSLLDFRVYGSRARGDFSRDSDLDIFIEVESISEEQRRKITEVASEVGFETDRVITTFVATRDQRMNGPLSADPILFKIEKEGVAV